MTLRFRFGGPLGLAALALGPFAPRPAVGDRTGQTLGTTAFYHCGGGKTGTARTLGNTTFFHFSDGPSGTTRRLGGARDGKVPSSRSRAHKYPRSLCFLRCWRHTRGHPVPPAVARIE